MNDEKDRKPEPQPHHTTTEPEPPSRELVIEDVDTGAAAEVKGGGVAITLAYSSGAASDCASSSG